MTSAQLQSFNALAAAARATLWPVSFTIGNDTAPTKVVVSASGSPPSRTRVADDARSGYILLTIRTIMLQRAQIPVTATVALGAEFTITVDALNPGNVGTIWRCMDLNDSNGGSELRCVCKRLD